MKIIDYSKQATIFLIAATALLVGGTVSQFRQAGPEDNDGWKMLAFALIWVGSLLYRGYHSWHHYILGPTGIDYSALFGLRKQHFDWYEIQSFMLCRVSGGSKRADYSVIVLSKLSPNELNIPGYTPSATWYWKRHKNIVMFRFNPLRYEYVCRYCNVSVLDMR